MKKKENTIGEMIDNIIDNPTIMITQLSNMLIDCKKINEDLQIKLKNKQSEIDYLKGQLSVYEKMLIIDEDIEKTEKNYNHISRID